MAQELLSLPLAQRLELVQALWDSIAAEQGGLEPSRQEQRLVEERLEAFHLDGNPGSDALQVLDELEQAL
jgi:hypothetical protein